MSRKACLLGGLSLVLALLACGSSSPARTSKHHRARHHGFRYTCVHRRSGRRPSALDNECGSLFAMPLPARPRLLHGSAAASAAMVRRIFAMGTGDVRPTQLNPPPGQDYGHPHFVASPQDPVYRVHCDRPVSHRCPIEGWRIRIPADARPADGGDGHMSVVDPAANREYDFYQVQTVPLPPGGGTLVAYWGGRSRLSGSGVGSPASCADAACTPLMDGVIQYSELAGAQINHALFIVAGCSNGRVVFPASREGGGGSCNDPTDAPATGQWLQLAMSPRQIAALPVPPWKKAIYTAMARYGAMVGDEGSTGAFDIPVESPETYTALGQPNPFVAWAARQRRRRRSHVAAYTDAGSTHYVLSFDDMSHLMGRMRVIDPCVIAGTCS